MDGGEPGEVALRAATLMILGTIVVGLLAWYGTLSGPPDVSSLAVW